MTTRRRRQPRVLPFPAPEPPPAPAEPTKGLTRDEWRYLLGVIGRSENKSVEQVIDERFPPQRKPGA